jgi:hypothetical protein
MSTEHPITPPPELVQEWIKAEDDPYEPNWQAYEEGIATHAAQWGADQELEACVKWVADTFSTGESEELRATRRPKSPSLKERAIKDLAEIGTHYICPGAADLIKTIRAALEALPND